MKYNEYREVDREYNYVAFSFGCGVQSTALLMLINYNPELLLNTIGHLPKKAYFADTGLEPQKVYKHLENLKNNGLFDNLLFERIETNLFNNLDAIPFFIKNDENKTGQLHRGCTSNFKIKPLRRLIRKDFKEQDNYSLKPKSVGVWLGISTDEIQRMKQAHVKYIENIFPLIELGWSRDDCKQYLESLGWNNVPKSACYICPYNNWKKTQKESPEEFKKACDFENNLNKYAKNNKYLNKLNKDLFINPKLKLLSEQFPNEIQENDDYMNEECDGMCGT